MFKGFFKIDPKRTIHIEGRNGKALCKKRTWKRNMVNYFDLFYEIANCPNCKNIERERLRKFACRK